MLDSWVAAAGSIWAVPAAATRTGHVRAAATAAEWHGRRGRTGLPCCMPGALQFFVQHVENCAAHGTSYGELYSTMLNDTRTCLRAQAG